MSKASKKINKRQVVMADGRYLIFYTFAPIDHLKPSPPDALTPEAKAKATKPAEEI